MKKRLIPFTILSVVFAILGLFLAFLFTAENYSLKLLGGTFLEPLHKWVYSASVQNFLAKGDLGPVFYIALLAVVIIVVLKLVFLRVAPVNDVTVPAIEVKQTTYAVDYSKESSIPDMVVVDEKKVGETYGK